MWRQLESIRRFIRAEIAQHKARFAPGRARDLIDLFLDEIHQSGESEVLNGG